MFTTIILITIFLTIGYAVFYKDLGLEGIINLLGIGKVRITKVELDTSATNQLDSSVLTVDEKTGNLVITYNITVSRQEITEKGTYLVYVENNSVFDYTYTGFSLNPEVKITNGSQDAGGATVSYEYDTDNPKHTLNVGETIKVGETKVAAVILTIKAGSENSNINIGISGGGNVNSSLENVGEFYGSVSTTSLDLSSESTTSNCFQVNVINTYNYRRSFNLTSTNENFHLTDTSGNLLSDLYIDPPSEDNPDSNNKTYDVCMVVDPDSIFITEETSTSIQLSSSGLTPTIIGDITIKVDKASEGQNDTAIPEVGNVTFTVDKYDQDSSSLITQISWTRLDTGGTDITDYYILLYDSADTSKAIGTYNVGSAATNYTLTMDSTFLTKYKENMVTNNNDYFVKVYGVDLAGNTGANHCSLSDGNTYCVASSNTKLKWEFDIITTGLTNMSLSSDSPTKAYINNTYSATFTSSSYYSLPSSITVTMGGEPLDVNTDYTYSSANSGAFNVITKVTGDISITGTATYSGGLCLVSGTKIKLSDGTYKNIEDIKYDDLVQAFSYDLGRIVYEYPIWIEKEGTLEQYQRTTFSDGTILETVGSHGVFSLDLNRYVSVIDTENFHVGTRVVKINDKGEIEVVRVEKIEQIHETISYYHISSTRYHNVIANDLLTTDAMLVISNMFPFDGDLTWSIEREKFLATNDLFYFQDWTHLFPPHIFKGFRMGEAKHLFNKGELDIMLFSQTLGSLIINPPVNENGKNVWMVTTSDDLSQGLKGNFYEEGSFYKLQEPIKKINKLAGYNKIDNNFDKYTNEQEFVGWYNTADNKYYQPGDLVEVDYGMYFEAVYK